MPIASIRTYFSITHIKTAAYFARQTSTIEDQYAISKNNPLVHMHRSYVMGAVLFSTAFLEANINELFSDAYDGHLDHFKNVEPAVTALMAKMWARGVPRTAKYSIMEKYEIALDLAGRQPLDRGSGPYQDVKLLIELRNALTHYEPEWINLELASARSTEPHKFEKRLHGKFKLSPLTSHGNPFYPDKCLGHGCTKWAVESAIALVDDFYHRFGTAPIFDQVRPELGTESANSNSV